ncbi:MAG: carboxypeptidase-like regulatory domain-containing protein, partial [Muribaculaceae bacterium]
MKKRIKINLRFLSSLVIAFCMCSLSSYAQNVITGLAKDANQEALPGVAVLVKGSNVGTITNLDGQFNIKAKKNDILVFSYVGMKSKEVKVTSNDAITVVMDDDLAALDEIVVVGYGTQKRGSITGAVSTVSDKELLRAPTMSMS